MSLSLCLTLQLQGKNTNDVARIARRIRAQLSGSLRGVELVGN